MLLIQRFLSHFQACNIALNSNNFTKITLSIIYGRNSRLYILTLTTFCKPNRFVNLVLARFNTAFYNIGINAPFYWFKHVLPKLFKELFDGTFIQIFKALICPSYHTLAINNKYGTSCFACAQSYIIKQFPLFEK